MRKSILGSMIYIVLVTLLLLTLDLTSVKAAVLWDGDASKGTSVFGTLNTEGGATITAVNDATYGTVWRFSKPSGSNRCESSHLPNDMHAQEGDTWFLGWRFRVEMPQNQTTNAVFQWKSYPNAQQNYPLVLKHMSGSFRLLYHAPSGSSIYPFSTATVVNTWIRIVLKIHVSRNASTGYVEMWYNGVQQVLSNGQTRYYCRTLDDGYNDPKWGIYGACETSMTNYVHGLKIGTTYEDVAPSEPGQTPTPTTTINSTVTPTNTPTPSTGSDNLALNKPVTCSSQQTGNEAAKMVDGDTASRWSAAPYPQWVRIDLGSVFNISKTELVPYSNRAYQYRVEVSTDGTNFTQVVNRTGNTTGGSLLTDTFTAVNARYVRLSVTGCYNYTGTWASIVEFRVFSTDSVATPTNTPTPSIVVTPTNTPTPSVVVTPTPTASSVTNLALNKPVTCSSEQTGNEVSHMVDGDATATRWSASPFPQWARIDLGATYSINKTELVPLSNRAYQYRVEVSTDGVSFTQVVDRTGNTTGGALLTDTFTVVNARYVRLTVTGCYNYTGVWISINEFRVFGN